MNDILKLISGILIRFVFFFVLFSKFFELQVLNSLLSLSIKIHLSLLANWYENSV